MYTSRVLLHHEENVRGDRKGEKEEKGSRKTVGGKQRGKEEWGYLEGT